MVIRGYRSLRDVDLHLDSPNGVTVLIGANGSGKSNIVGALELVSRIVDDALQSTLLELGGIDRLLTVGASEEPATSIELELWFEADAEGVCNGYRARILPAEDDEGVLDETLYIHDTKNYERPYDEPLPSGRETKLDRVKNLRLQTFAGYIRPSLEGLGAFHFDDVGKAAPPRLTSEIGNDRALEHDARNLPAYLYRLQSEHPQTYQRIRTVVRNVAPFFDDFVLEPQGRDLDKIRLRWTQRGTSSTFLASQLSDGTLRFICLATALLSPHRPQCIVLDEPELGLHPFAIHQLAALIQQSTSGGRRCVVATQSPLLIDEFPLEAIAVLDRENGVTKITRPDAEELEAFLDDYSLGEIWRKNLLGGRPQRSEASGQ